VDDLTESQRRTKERDHRRNSQFTAKGRERSSIETPFGREAIKQSLKPLADFISQQLNTAPSNLADVIGRLNPYELAAITLVRIWDGILWGFEGNDWRSKRSLYQSVGQYLKDRLEFAEINIVKAIGKQIKRGRPRAEDFLREEWRTGEYVSAGWWLVERAVESRLFEWRGNSLVIPPDREAEFKRLRQAILWSQPYMLPHLKPPSNWTGWRKHYDDRLSTTFITGWRNDQRPDIEERLKGSFPHAEAVNHRKRVAPHVNPAMLPIVEEFAVECMGHNGWKRQNDERTVDGDLEDARWLGDRTFWLDYRCDSRGRMYAVQRFSYDREDHVRSLIEFNQGVHCGPYGIQWLEFNAANLYGNVDKESWGKRGRWTTEHRHLIREIVKDPIGTFDKWRKADKPLQFVRSCFELVEAWDNPDFETRLPVGIDATASGLQHLALLGRDRETMAKVNLTLVHDGALDIYGAFAEHIEQMLRADSHSWATWWLDRLKELGSKKRKLFKGRWGHLLMHPRITAGISKSERRVRIWNGKGW